MDPHHVDAATFGRLYNWSANRDWCAQTSPEGYLDACVGTVTSNPFVRETVDLFFGLRRMGVTPTLTEYHEMNPRTRLGLLACQDALTAIENWSQMPDQAELSKRKAAEAKSKHGR